MSRLLVVDDDTFVRSALRMNLEDHGFEIVEAIDGVDALEKLRKDRFDLVLTDYDMPRMDGVEFTWGVRKFDPRIPVLMMSAYINPEWLKEESGVDAFFTKGRFRMRDIVEEVRRLIATPRCIVEHTVELRDGRRVFAQLCRRK